MPDDSYETRGELLHSFIYWPALTWLSLFQAPPTDAGFYEAWDQLGPQAILVAVLVAGGFLFWRLLKRSWDTEDRLDAENTNLTRQNEHMALEGMNAIRDFTTLLRELEKELGALKIEIATKVTRREP